MESPPQASLLSPQNSLDHQNGYPKNGHPPSNGNGHGNVNGNGTIAPLQLIPINYASSEQADDSDFDLASFLKILRRRMLPFVTVTTLVAMGMWTRTLLQTPIYQGHFRILVESVSSDRPISDLIQPGENADGLDYATQIQVLSSPEILEPIVQNIKTEYPEVSVSNLLPALTIQRLNDTKILEIKYTDSDTGQIQSVLEYLSQGYLDYSLRERQTSLRQGINFVEDQLPQMRQRVNTLQQMLQELQQNYRFVDPALRTQELTVQLSSLSQELFGIEQQLLQAESQYQNLQQVPGATIALRNDPSYQSQLSQVQAIENQLALELARSLDSSLEVQALARQRENLIPLLSQGAESALNVKLAEASQIIASLQQQQARILDQGSQLQSQINQLPALSRVFNELQQELEIARGSLNRLLAARESLQLESAQKEIPWQLLVVPETLNTPVSPNVSRNLLSSLLLGIALGIGTALLLDRLDNVFHSLEQLREETKQPILGVIPFSPDLSSFAMLENNGLGNKVLGNKGFGNTGFGNKGLGDGIVEHSLSTPHYKAKPLIEAFRSLAINLRFMGADSPLRSLVISSAMPGDGKSTIALNLAQAAAAMGQRVLLIDADLRRPQLHKRLSLFNGQGLANLISGGVASPEAVIQPSGIEERLWVLTSGQRPPDPSRLLSSETLKRLNRDFQSRFDLVIYDTPPLLGLSDASLLSNQCDGILVVAGMGQTDREALKRSLESLKNSRSTILGIVGNAVKQLPGSRYDNYYYSYKYQQYYSDLPESAESQPS